jgi:hypothetical protein
MEAHSMIHGAPDEAGCGEETIRRRYIDSILPINGEAGFASDTLVVYDDLPPESWRSLIPCMYGCYKDGCCGKWEEKCQNE